MRTLSAVSAVIVLLVATLGAPALAKGGPSDSASGGVQLVAEDGVPLQVTFHANEKKQDGRVTWWRLDPAGAIYITWDVECVNVVDDRAYFAGQVIAETFGLGHTEIGDWDYFVAEDIGEPSTADSLGNRSLNDSDQQTACLLVTAEDTSVDWYDVIGGNIQVRDRDNDK
jgi:hypothetical protein